MIMIISQAERDLLEEFDFAMNQMALRVWDNLGVELQRIAWNTLPEEVKSSIITARIQKRDALQGIRRVN